MASKIALLLAAATIATPSSAHDAKVLPLGDGKISSSPMRGHVFACSTTFHGGGGADRSGPWISDNQWYPGRKAQVEGSVLWPNAVVSISVENGLRIIRANSLPLHATGTFPIKPGTEAYLYDRNPNRIGERPILLTLPAQPRAAEQPGCVPMGMIGLAISGVAIFNAFDLQGRDAPAYEIQDQCNGHPERTSQYHYHDWSPCLATGKADAPVGWMLDGYPILGPVRADGTIVRNEDLDECHGTTGPVDFGETVAQSYHYRFTYEFPYTIGCFRGAVQRIPPR